MLGERIVVIGCCGCGKSTLSIQLSQRLGLPVIHLDRLYWRSNWTPVTNEEFDEALKAELDKPRWIMDGNFGRTMAWRLSCCDTVIYMDFPRWLCVYGVLKRVLLNHGKTRDDMGQNCPERFDLAFLKYVWSFHRKNRDKIYKRIEELEGKEIILLHSRKECKQLLL